MAAKYRSGHQHNAKLGEEELVAFVNKYFANNIRMSIHDLKNPNPGKIKRVYEAFLFEFGFNLKHVHQPLWTDKTNEMTEDDQAVYNCHLSVLMERVLKTVGSDFRMHDLTAPRPKRTQVILTLLKNYWEFIYNRYQNYSEYKESLMKDAESRKAQHEQIEVLKKKINNRKLKEAEQEPELKLLRNTNAQLKHEMELRCKEKVDVKNKSNENKANLSSLKAILATLKVKMAELEEESVELNSRIPTEDDTKALEKLAWENENLSEIKAEKRNRVSEVKALGERIKKMKSELGSALELALSFDQDLKKYNEVEQKLDNFRKTADAERAKQSQLSNEFNRARKLLGVRETALAFVSAQETHNLQSMTERIEEVKMDLPKQEQRWKECSEVEKDQIDIIEKLENKIKSDEDKLEEEKNELRELFASLVQKVVQIDSEALEDLSNMTDQMLS